MKAESCGKIPEHLFELTEKMTPSEVAELYQSQVRTFENLLEERRRVHFLFRSLLLSLMVNFVAIGGLVLILTGLLTTDIFLNVVIPSFLALFLLSGLVIALNRSNVRSG